MNHICATLLVLCSLSLPTDEREMFAERIKECAVIHNASYLAPHERIPVTLVVAIAAHESGWGASRFAVEGNNFFGIRTTEDDNYIIPRKNTKIKLATYLTICDGVDSFMELLLNDYRYQGFVDELDSQWFLDVINYEKLIYNLDAFSTDRLWQRKILKIIGQLDEI